MLTYTGQVCLVLISTKHTNETPEKASLHKIHIACATFVGRDGGSLLHLFRDTLSAIYENILNLDCVDTFHLPEDYFTTLNEAVDASNDQQGGELDARTRLHLFEFSNITKTGGINNPYVTMEWLEIQIPQVVISNLNEKPLKLTFSTDKGAREEHFLSFYEKSPVGRGLDFTENPDVKEDLPGTQ